MGHTALPASYRGNWVGARSPVSVGFSALAYTDGASIMQAIADRLGGTDRMTEFLRYVVDRATVRAVHDARVRRLPEGLLRGRPARQFLELALQRPRAGVDVPAQPLAAAERVEVGAISIRPGSLRRHGQTGGR